MVHFEFNYLASVETRTWACLLGHGQEVGECELFPMSILAHMVIRCPPFSLNSEAEINLFT